jgi:putative ABC transport system permease protein
VGSGAFPVILWEAYKIMLHMTDSIELRINWVLCGIVVGSYTAVMLGVTWYCCRRALREVPAELIRPKSPDPGKKILLEYMPFWKHISFLNKVTLRNMFRYRQRLAMMIVGIGGCTALLVTGFGLRDSIINVVDFQFENITTYDMSVYFSEGRTEEQQADFLSDIREYAENAMFYHQSSVEIEKDNKVKEIYLIAGETGMDAYIDLHTGETPIPLPKNGELVLSVGVATAMGIEVGDTVILRDADMRILNLTVSGIYDNHVYNYGIISPDTVLAQWGEEPPMQMAFLNVKEGLDDYEVSAEISKKPGVMNVSVSVDLANMVGRLMKALDLVIVVVVVCAGTLAFVVLYNLTNINITERIREIATIKVLGFRSGETGAYVFKENMALTAIGSIFGLGLGYVLLQFVMAQIKIDMVWFSTVILPPSYCWALVLTALSACVVDFVFYFKLEQINMAEALKSVE